MPGLGADVETTLEWCLGVGRVAPRVGEGATPDLWEILAGIAAMDVSAARMLEPHLDALSILHEAGVDFGIGADEWGVAAVGAGDESTWGVFAAEGPGVRLDARQVEGSWRLTGTKPWCSLASHVSHALVTAFVDDTHRRLFAVGMRSAGVHPRRGEWFARGLPHVVSSPVDFDDVEAVPVGADGWYLSRPGFARGGMSVAACWWGAAEGVAAALVAPASSERADQLSLVYLGRVDAALWGARATLAEAARAIDDDRVGVDEKLLAERVRAVVADAATSTLAEADAALGPAPLVSDPDHARRVADLHLYLRQHHGLRDVARIGRSLASGGR
ncbi:acyl-CoA dehydrogenase [Microbacterium rhizomatis]|uniref:Acyl-CoA dehydrogenase n=1 Tax=Microbacterium rhizomatis TaxID=1631477 RepID=A0A5J5J1Y0_9MICO|nr:acyl-CoA dehydrogenase [Microbacterium rhizomatis]